MIKQVCFNDCIEGLLTSRTALKYLIDEIDSDYELSIFFNRLADDNNTRKCFTSDALPDLIRENSIFMFGVENCRYIIECYLFTPSICYFIVEKERG